jgi:hypothetical protein
MIYNPPASVVPFLVADKFANFIVGPVGSTKTTASLIKIAYEAKRVAPCRDGIRRSRVAVVRNTNQMLWDTTIPDFLKWYGDAGLLEKTHRRFQMKFDDCEVEVLFRGLDDANDVRRLLSLQLSFGVMDEFREIHKDIYEALTGRLGRYPDKTMNGVGCCEIQPDGTAKQIHKVWAASNPPDFDTYWETLLNNPPDNAHVTMQPSGMDPKADWVQYLPDGYYENLCEGKSEDWIDVYVHGKFGKSLAGQPVFKSFEPDFHIAEAPLRPIINGLRPVIVGLDFGLTPAAVIGQLDMRGRLLIMAEATSEGMGILRFTRTKLKPLLAEKFPGAPVLVVGDPAGKQRVQTDESTVYEILKAEGLKAIPALTNSIVARINAVEIFLSRQIDGGAGFLVDPSCRMIIGALRGRYRYKLKTNGEMDDKPEKNDASHIADALQYLALHADAQASGKLLGTKRREVRQISAIGWT